MPNVLSIDLTSVLVPSTGSQRTIVGTLDGKSVLAAHANLSYGEDQWNDDVELNITVLIPQATLAKLYLKSTLHDTGLIRSSIARKCL